MRDPDHRKESEKFQSFGLSSSTAMLSSAEATLTNMPAKHQRSRTASGRTKGNFGPMTSTDRPTRCYSESSCLGPSSGCKNEDCPSFEVVRHEVEKVSESNAYPTPYAQQQAEDESLYCFCRQVSFGQMIGCDNEGCPIEWFHLRCVGLTQPPKGHWYCPRCLM
ncbi:hypothetical protein BJ742DRAFT_317247 [Cladochytrium replicatum]|nr:hypothetical protein BJ742DRAFT_317247 [Cladochytrium replicatum]